MEQGPLTGLETQMANVSLQVSYKEDNDIDYFILEASDKNAFAELFEKNYQNAAKEAGEKPTAIQFALRDYYIDLTKYDLNDISQIASLKSKVSPLLWMIKNYDLSATGNYPALGNFSRNLTLLTTIIRYNLMIEDYKKNGISSVKDKDKYYDLLMNTKAEFTNIDIVFFVKEGEDSVQRKIMQQCLHQIMRASCVFDDNWMGLNELNFHVERKNKAAKLNQTSYHAEVINNPTSYSFSEVDKYCIEQLISKMHLIRKGLQPRTQFLVYVDGIFHALVLDVSWNKNKNQFDMICVESTNTIIQHYFLENFLTGLLYNLGDLIYKEMVMLKYEIIGISTGLQKNSSSCATYALALSAEVSKTSFAELKSLKDIPQPKFYNKDGLSELENLKILWRPVTALGTKVVLMGQSFTEMEANLKVLLPQKPQEIKSLINMVKTDYQLPGKEEQKSYITYRREALRLKTQNDPFAGLSIEYICQKTNSSSSDLALRKRALGGPKREFDYLLTHLPTEDIHKKGTQSQQNALHYAYKGNKGARAQLLISKGVDSKAKDKDGKTPSDYKKAIVRV